MATNQDIVNSSLKDLLPKYEELFSMSHPLLQKLWNGVEQSTLQSYQRLFDVVTGDPGTLIGIRSGGEMIAPSRKNVSAQGSEDAYLGMYAFNIPGKDLDEANGPKDIVKIINKYPELGLKGFTERFARQFATGKASAGTDPADQGANGYTTLNGSQSYNPQGTAKTGIFQMAARIASPDSGAGQTGTVHGLPLEDAASSPTPGWYHQYGLINSMSLDGNMTMRKTVGRANDQGGQLEGGGVDLLLGDEGSFQQHIESLDDKVWITEIVNPAAKYTKRRGVKFDSAEFYHEPAIDIADTTAFTNANAQLGVIYVFTTSFWEWFILQNNQLWKGKKNGNFRIGEPIPLQDQYGYQYRISVYGNLCCHNLRAQGIILGGSQA